MLNLGNWTAVCRCALAAIGLLILGVSVAEGADVSIISQGRRVDLEQHLVPGKLVLIDFYADWCVPCRIMEPYLDRLAELHPDSLAVRKVDVINWDSPVARQYRITVLPYLMLYGPGGDLLADGDPERVLQVLETRLGGNVPSLPIQNRGPITVLGWVVVVSALVATVVLLRRRRSEREGHTATGSARADVVDLPGVWLTIVDGSLEGPFSVQQLADLRARHRLDDDSRVRRRGDATWRRLADVIEEQG